MSNDANVDRHNSEIPIFYAKSKQEGHHKYLEPAFKKIFTDVSLGAKILDMGCGTGYLTNAMAQMGYHVSGMDVSESGVRLAQATYPHLKFYKASVVDNSLGETTGKDFDVVTAFELIEHIYSPRAFFENSYKLLKPKGVLVISTPYHGYFKNLLMTLSGRFDRHVMSAHEGGHIKFWSKKTLTNILAKYGFETVDFKGCGSFPFLWKSMLLKAYKK